MTLLFSLATSPRTDLAIPHPLSGLSPHLHIQLQNYNPLPCCPCHTILVSAGPQLPWSFQVLIGIYIHSSGKCLLKFSLFLNLSCFSFCWLTGVFPYSGYKSLTRNMICKYFLLSCRLSFHFNVLWWTKVLNLKFNLKSNLCNFL